MTVLILVIIGLSACGKSTSDTLQSQKWTFDSTKNQDGTNPTAQFSAKKLTLSEGSLNKVYSYTISQNSSKEVITFVDKNSITNRNEVRKFEIKKTNDEYKLTPINSLAKSDTGNVTLIPKK
ncbi:hypothetical protein FC89_GL000230 [Liquorilactobacillus ghanensis DSM 18630]|uniref:Uncharacterized protein n=2 Tax=Liquorilactobacillus ghanensis TaxID=399370 RepID=A0A0R1VP88_9LACO|nr:hypothetical protein FC89_GL000230 [Liquorilactobacillus ghanensis DSM 18630]